MLGFLKSQELRAQEGRVHEIGTYLFRQVAAARDAAYAGKISEDEFKQRINSMYVGGYLIGFVDSYIPHMFESERQRAKYAARIINGIFPKSGVQLVQARLAQRRLAEDLRKGEHADKLTKSCAEFDAGDENARTEASAWDHDDAYEAHRLYYYMLTGNAPGDADGHVR